MKKFPDKPFQTIAYNEALSRQPRVLELSLFVALSESGVMSFDLQYGSHCPTLCQADQDVNNWTYMNRCFSVFTVP